MTGSPPRFPLQSTGILRTCLILPRHLRSTLRRFRSFYQILENEKLLFILLDPDQVVIYIDHLPAMNLTIQRDRAVKCLNREKLGDKFLFAFDETKRALVVCASAKVFSVINRNVLT
jgi:hypothetical protein